MLAVQIIFIVVFGVVIFLLLREFWCWYFKINEQIALRKETNKLLQTQKELMLRKMLHEGIITKEEIEREEKK